MSVENGFAVQLSINVGVGICRGVHLAALKNFVISSFFASESDKKRTARRFTASPREGRKVSD